MVDIPGLNIEVVVELVEFCEAKNGALGFAPYKSSESVLETSWGKHELFVDISRPNIEVVVELAEFCGAKNDELGFAPNKSLESVVLTVEAAPNRFLLKLAPGDGSGKGETFTDFPESSVEAVELAEFCTAKNGDKGVAPNNLVAHAVPEIEDDSKQEEPVDIPELDFETVKLAECCLVKSGVDAVAPNKLLAFAIRKFDDDSGEERLVDVPELNFGVAEVAAKNGRVGPVDKFESAIPKLDSGEQDPPADVPGEKIEVEFCAGVRVVHCVSPNPVAPKINGKGLGVLKKLGGTSFDFGEVTLTDVSESFSTERFD